MGNRAIITTKKRDLGVYLHWNGGRDSVGAFLEYCELRGFRSPDADPYGWARLCQVVCNYMGAEGLSVGISRYEGDARMDPGDNGIYVIEGWRIARRLTTEYGPGWEPVGMREVRPEEEQDVYSRAETLRDIDAAQPEDQRLGAYLDAEEVPASGVVPGDEVFMRRVDGRFEAYLVAGVGDGRTVNGLDTSGVPYVAMYGADDAGWSGNVNNYLLTPTVRRVPVRAI